LPISVLLIIDEPARKRRRLAFNEEEDWKLCRAVILVQKYVGLPRTPWTIVRRAFPDRKESSLKNRHRSCEERYKGRTSRFLATFEKHFAAALKRDEVKAIEHGGFFDLEYYLDWYDSNNFPYEEGREELPTYISILLAEFRDWEVTELPSTLDELTRLFDVEIPSQELQNDWLGDYHRREYASSKRRHDALYSEAFVLPRHATGKESHDDTTDNLTSLIKVYPSLFLTQATILTPDSLHDKQKTRDLLGTFGAQAVQRCVDDLIGKKLVVRISADRERVIPGRHYRMSDKYVPDLQWLIIDGA
jgi:hypothetical protein